jgi:succinate-semialdehyde dehydrogenase/glutarate-semialdehyde dehydrogenase
MAATIEEVRVTGKQFIDGEWRDGRGEWTIEVRSPATGRHLGSLPVASAADVDDAVAAARRAQADLDAMTVHERAALLHRTADLLESRAGDLARELTLEQGKLLHAEAHAEIEETAGNFRMAAEDVKRMDTRVIPAERRGKMVFTFRKPNGVFAVITPWNFPLMIPSELVAPALATGNAVVLKPSEFTPLAGARLVEIMAEAGFPPGAVNLVFGRGDVGGTLVAHAGVDAVAFVGSHTTGEAIVRAAGLKRTLIEGSGNGPQIVLDDADLGAAATAAVEGATFLAGQVCVATERVLVHRGVHDEFVERVLKEAGEVRLGDPFAEDTTMGPLNNEAVAAKLDRHMDDARERGARILLGGKRASGFPTPLYYPITVVDDVATDTLLFREESFGPVLPVTTFGDDDEAVRLANDSHLGLQAAVFTSSLKRAFTFMDRLRVGNLQINESTGYWEGRPPFGGAAGTKTGWGRIQLEDFTDLRTVTVDFLNTRD